MLHGTPLAPVTTFYHCADSQKFQVFPSILASSTPITNPPNTPNSSTFHHLANSKHLDLNETQCKNAFPTKRKLSTIFTSQPHSHGRSSDKEHLGICLQYFSLATLLFRLIRATSLRSLHCCESQGSVCSVGAKGKHKTMINFQTCTFRKTETWESTSDRISLNVKFIMWALVERKTAGAKCAQGQNEGLVCGFTC